MTMPGGDRTTAFDAQRNSSASFPAAVSGPNHSLKFTESGFQRFSPVNDPTEVEERDAASFSELSDDSSRAIRLLKETGSKVTEELSIWMPNLLSLLRHDDPAVVKQSITTGTRLFSAVLTEMALQVVSSSKVERWLEKLWSLMVQFKDAIFDMVVEPGSIGSKVYAAKFLENCFLLFTSDGNEGEMSKMEGTEENFNISWLVQGHPTLNPTMATYEAGRILSLFFDILKSADMHGGILVITVINCLASIAKKRVDHYNSILSALLDFDPNSETLMRFHAASIQYAVRIALIGLVRCTHSSSVESKEKLSKILRERYNGEITEHTIRQMEKLARSVERTSRNFRPIKMDPPPSQASNDLTRMRSLIERGDSAAVSDEMPSKRTRLGAATITSQPIKVNSDLQDANSDADSSSSLNTSLVNTELSPAEKMIVAIGALLAEGDKGAQSLELLLSQIHADLLADIVIETMKHIPNSPFSLSERNGSKPPSSQTSLSSFSPEFGPNFPAVSGLSSTLSSELVSGSAGMSTPVSDTISSSNIAPDVKRDPRRDPRRLDPRRAVVSVDVSSIQSSLESDTDIQHGSPHPLSKSTLSGAANLENAPLSEIELNFSESLVDTTTDRQASQENLEIINDTSHSSTEGEFPSDLVFSPVHSAEAELDTSFEITENEDMDGNMAEPDQFSCPLSFKTCSEGNSSDLPVLPPYITLTNEQEKSLCRSAITRLIEDYKQVRAIDCGQTRLPLLARLFAQTDADEDLVMFFRKHIVSDYHDHEGHELALHVLYHLHTIMNSELDEYAFSATNNYEKFLMDVTTTLLDSLPASDKSFSRLLGDAPFLPKSALTLLEDLCQLRGYENHTKDTCDGDRVTQGLGAVWSLILGRPLYRQACLDIALKCSIHSHDEVRTKAIRLVANKLFLLPYASESIEKFARSVMLSAVDQQVSEVEIKPPASIEQITQTGSQETSVSGSHYSDRGPSESEPSNGMQLSQSIPPISFLHAQQQTSLYFALCLKKPSLLHVVFDIYGRAQKVVKQSIHRHISGLVRSLGPTHPELLHIISNPPDGSENLIMLVLQILTEDSTPPLDLITAVKHLYDTKLKDVAVLIPMLSSLSKDEVLPIFPRLVDLPLEKFQAALARILQGSAHTGPALTPVEVLVAIHEVNPARDGVALKKITDVCTACFEQRTVFTQQVLAKSLSHMVEQVPLPMLFMRTVIQAIGTFPALVDFVMEILSKLVSKQIWKMPKLWVGFLKLVSQTHPHSFNVLLQLPPPQLENALSKYANLRGPLASYANQPNIRTSLTRETLQILGLAGTQQAPPRPFIPAALHSSDAGSSVHSATLS